MKLKYPMAANLNDEGKKEFAEIFTTGEVPVLTPVAQQIEIEGQNMTVEAYMVNLNLVTEQELNQIAEKLSKKFGAPKEALKADIKERGLPLRSKFVNSVSIDPRFLL
jgi:uncharacterized NAD-dependent epimerase/dehydratase family protein